MIIIAAMKAAREIWIETTKLRKELAKRYPRAMFE
jgi:hypothetical protein